MGRAAPKVHHDEPNARLGHLRTPPGDRPLQVSEEGISRLRAQLEAANRDNPNFSAHYEHLMDIVGQALARLRTHELAPLIELVLAAGAWAREGIDLRTLPTTEEVYLLIVVRLAERDYDFDTRMSAEVFAPVNDGSFLLHFTVLTARQWEHALQHLGSSGRSADLLGIPLLVRR